MKYSYYYSSLTQTDAEEKTTHALKLLENSLEKIAPLSNTERHFLANNSNRFWRNIWFGINTAALLCQIFNAIFQFKNTFQGFSEIGIQSKSTNTGLSLLLASGDFFANTLSISPRNNANDYMLQDSKDYSKPLLIFNFCAVSISAMSNYPAASLISVVGALDLLRFDHQTDPSRRYAAVAFFSLLFLTVGIAYCYMFDSRARQETLKAIMHETHAKKQDLGVFRSLQTFFQCLCITAYRSLVSGGSAASYIRVFPQNQPTHVLEKIGVILAMAGTVINVISTRLFKINQYWRNNEFSTIKNGEKESFFSVLFSVKFLKDLINSKTGLASSMTAGLAMIIFAFTMPISSALAWIQMTLSILPFSVYLIAQTDLTINERALFTKNALEIIDRELVTDESEIKIFRNAFAALAKTFENDQDIQLFAKCCSTLGRIARLVGFLSFTQIIAHIFGRNIPLLANVGFLFLIALPNTLNQYSQYRDNIIAVLSQKRAEAWVISCMTIEKQPNTIFLKRWSQRQWQLFTTGAFDYQAKDIQQALKIKSEKLRRLNHDTKNLLPAFFKRPLGADDTPLLDQSTQTASAIR